MLVALLAAGAVCAQAQNTDTPQDPNDEETTRGTFLSSRPPAAAAGASLGGSAGTGPSISGNAGTGGRTSTGRTTTGRTSTGTGGTGRASTGRTTTGRTTTGRTSSGRTTTGRTSTGGTTGGSVKSYANQPIGLGYSIFMRDSEGFPVRVDPERAFRSGDRIRIALETNVDGYLYVFHTENDGAPEMIFPDARLNSGKNWVSAHVTHEIPSRSEPVAANQWFTFDNNPAIERLYIVVTREPLPQVPTGAQLVSICKQSPGSCPLRMSDANWVQVKEGLNAKTNTSRMKEYGQKEDDSERESAVRGLGLSQAAPAPAVVRLNVDGTGKVLVTAIDLVHN
jgi:hypothetical protein